MPPILEKCVNELLKKGKNKSSAYAICTASLKKAGKLTDSEVKKVIEEQQLTDVQIQDLLDERFITCAEIKFDETTNEPLTEIEMIRTGYFLNSYYGELNITLEMFNTFVKNFKNNVLQRDISFDCEHIIDMGAVAWLKELKVIQRPKSKKKDPYYLVGTVEFTEPGKELIKKNQYKYFSLDYTLDYKNKEDPKDHYGATVLGGGITNRPFIPGLRPIKYGDKISLAEKSEERTFNEIELMEVEEQEDNKLNDNEKVEDVQLVSVKDIPWSKVDKSKLPAKCFAYVPDKEKRSMWKLPYKNSDGSLNPNGVSAAMAAMHGARGGLKGVSIEARKKIQKAWEAVKKWRERTKGRMSGSKKLSEYKEEKTVKVKELLEIQLKELVALKDTLEKDSDEYKDIESKIKVTEMALKDLGDMEAKLSIIDKSKIEEKKEETKLEEKKEDKKIEEKVEDKKTKEPVKLTDEVVKLRERLDTAEKEMARKDTRLAELEVTNKRSRVEKDVMEYQQKGIPKPLIDFYKGIALSDVDESKSIKLSDGDFKGKYSATSMIRKLFDILPDQCRIKLTEETTSQANTSNEEEEVVRLAREYAKTGKKSIKK